MVNYTQAPWSGAYPFLQRIADERPCVPVGNLVQGTRWCGGQFTDVSDADVVSWNMSFVDNEEQC